MIRPSVIPAPTVMPVDRAKWVAELNLSNFLNTWSQYRDLQRFPDIRSVLVIGLGQGLDTAVLKWRGYDVTTLDIDETFHPDHIGSVHDLSVFADSQFDAVIASHVLEHLAEPFLNPSLKELARVGRYACIYLPVAGRRCLFRFGPVFRGPSLVLDIFNYFEKPDGVTAKYCCGQHFWEIGYRGYRVGDVKQRMERFFDVVEVYRNREWPSSMNFVLRSLPLR